ncbi:MAG: helix-turn-helix domain-containing protein [Cyanobacteriota bacterium]
MPRSSALSDPGSEALRLLGRQLAMGRLQAGLDLADLADRLHLGHEQLLALEEGDGERLPEPVFVVAMARRVAGVLAIPIEEPLNAFKLAVAAEHEPRSSPLPAARGTQPSRSWRRWLKVSFGLSTP